MSDGHCTRVFANPEINRLEIILCGTITRQRIDSIYTDIRFCVADLKPGFQVITDLTEARLGHLSGVATFRKIARYLQEHEVGTIVRIIKAPRVIVKQLARLTETIPDYRVRYVSSRTEAERLFREGGPDREPLLALGA